MSELFFTYNVLNEHFNNIEQFASKKKVNPKQIKTVVTHNVTVIPKKIDDKIDDTVADGEEIVNENSKVVAEKTYENRKSRIIGTCLLILALLIAIFRISKNLKGPEKDRNGFFYIIMVLLSAICCSPCYIAYGGYYILRNKY